jgi:hypothetical protein
MIEQQTRSAVQVRSDGRQLTEQMLERRRRINRESMRRRRAERAKSLGAEKLCTTDSLEDSSTLVAGDAQRPVKTRRCAICRVRKSVEEVIRLLPSARARSGFVQVRIPYCGCC